MWVTMAIFRLLLRHLALLIARKNKYIALMCRYDKPSPPAVDDSIVSKSALKARSPKWVLRKDIGSKNAYQPSIVID